MDAEKSLTISSRRLAGNACCLNCGTELEGPFCHWCGQPDKNLLRFFPVLVRELMEDFLDFDSRFMRTIKPLLFHPGKLTRDYLDGRRFRYTPPLRIYIFSSIVFFFLAATLAGNSVNISTSDDGEGGTNVSISTDSSDSEKAENTEPAADRASAATGEVQLDDEDQLSTEDELSQAQFEKALEAIEQLDPAIRENITIDEEDRSITVGADMDVPIGIVKDKESGENSFSFNDRPWHREDNPLIIPFLPDSVNDWINDEIGESPAKAEEIENNPRIIIDQIFDVLPVTMFLLLPFAALILKFWYLFSRTYYVEHLIYALHNHSFLFVILLLSMVSNAISAWVDPEESGWVATAVFWFNIAIVTWIPLYFLVSLKRVYRQGWPLTLTKYLLVSTSYLVLLTVASTIAGIFAFVLL